MQPPQFHPEGIGGVLPGKIGDLAQTLLDAEADAAVIDADGRVIGRLSRAAVLDVLVSRSDGA